MSSSSIMETIIGLIVIIVSIVFIFYSIQMLDNNQKGQIIKVEFGNVGSLKKGDDVRISGIKIGEVINNKLDYETFNAIVFLNIEEKIILPDDSLVKISNSSLLGGNFIEIIPGISDEVISSGGALYNSIDSISFSDLLGKALFSN